MTDTPRRRRPGSPQFPSTGRLNSLGLSRRELDQLLDEIDAQCQGEDPSPARRYLRKTFRHARLRLQIHQPAGNSAVVHVACRNISRMGMSLLHSAYLHVNTRCTVTLPRTGAPPLDVAGIVTRCEHRRGMIHELGVRFDAPVDLRSLHGLESAPDWFSLEQVNPEELHGRLLYVEDSALDRQLIRHHLRDTQIIVTCAEGYPEGLAKAPTGFDVILAASHIAGTDAVAFYVQLRARGIGTPLIVLVPEEADPVRTRLATAPGAAVIAKPVDRPLLLRAIGEFLIICPDAQRQAHPGAIALDSAGLEDLVHEFLTDLPRLTGELTQARAADETESCRQICLKLRSAAATLRFLDLVSLADSAALAIAERKSLTEAAVELDRLTDACRRPHTLRAA